MDTISIKLSQRSELRNEIELFVVLPGQVIHRQACERWIGDKLAANLPGSILIDAWREHEASVRGRQEEVGQQGFATRTGGERKWKLPGPMGP